MSYALYDWHINEDTGRHYAYRVSGFPTYETLALARKMARRYAEKCETEYCETFVEVRDAATGRTPFEAARARGDMALAAAIAAMDCPLDDEIPF